MSPPKIVFGGAGIGQDFATLESVQELLAVLKALDVLQIDTAARYPPGKYGKSEELLGNANAAAEGFSVGTKILMGAGDGSGELDSSAIQASVSESFERLGVNQVDVLYCHRPDPKTPLVDTATALNEQYKRGAFKRLGVSNFSPEQVRELVSICDENKFVRPSVYQGDYNLITRGMEKVLLPLLRSCGISFYAFRPLAAGFLTGKFYRNEHEDTRFSDTHMLGKFFQNLYGHHKLQEAMETFESTLPALGISDTEAALRWICYHSVLGENDAIILGASKLQHVRENLESIRKGPLPKTVVDDIDRIWESLSETRGGIL